MNTVPVSEARANTGPAGQQRWDGAGWISITNAPVLLPSRTEQRIGLRVTAPANAEPGDRRAYLLVRVIPEVPTGTVAIAPAFGVRVFISVPGAEVRRVDSLRLGAEHDDTLPLGSPVSLSAMIKNAGSVSLQSGGQVVIERWLGGEVARLNLPNERIMPDELARVAAAWESPPRWELFGRYRARFDFADETLMAATPPAADFWVINWTSIGWAVAAVFGAWLLRLNRVVRAGGRGLLAGARAFRDGMRST